MESFVFHSSSQFPTRNAAGPISLPGSFDFVRRLASESTDSAQDDNLEGEDLAHHDKQ
jgi:hypothetical protein